MILGVCYHWHHGQLPKAGPISVTQRDRDPGRWVRYPPRYVSLCGPQRCLLGCPDGTFGEGEYSTEAPRWSYGLCAGQAGGTRSGLPHSRMRADTQKAQLPEAGCAQRSGRPRIRCNLGLTPYRLPGCCSRASRSARSVIHPPFYHTAWAYSAPKRVCSCQPLDRMISTTGPSAYARVMGLVPSVILTGPGAGVSSGGIAGFGEHPGAEDRSQAGLGGDGLSVRVLPEIGLDLPLQGCGLLVQRRQDRDQGAVLGSARARRTISLAGRRLGRWARARPCRGRGPIAGLPRRPGSA